MRTILLALPLALAACGTERAAPTATGSPAATASAAPSPSPAPSLVTTAVRPAPGALHTVGDWIVGCDNVRLCTMASLGPEAGEFPPVTMSVLRQPGPEGRFDLGVAALDDAQPIVPVAAVIDGRRLPLAQLNGAPAAALVRAMAAGQRMTLVPAKGSAATLSLKGASAALRWIDAAQGRAGTRSAAVAIGPAPASAVPPAVPAPVVRARIARGEPAMPDAATITAMRRRAQCADDTILTGDLARPEVHALGDGATLVMLPCATGAYNLSQALFVLKGKSWASAQADAPMGFAATPANGLDAVLSIVNGSWEQGELTGTAKGRGLGDCGVSQTWVWDGNRLRLTEQAEMNECRGNPNYITTWRTQVVRGE